VAGICHARGSNANLPPQWLIYINVADVDKSVQRCVEMGGSPLRSFALGFGRGTAMTIRRHLPAMRLFCNYTSSSRRDERRSYRP
ncbi:MAG: hypothetical protein ACE1ZA_20350, partial [Pseudomonadales bacterium]